MYFCRCGNRHPCVMMGRLSTVHFVIALVLGAIFLVVLWVRNQPSFSTFCRTSANYSFSKLTDSSLNLHNQHDFNCRQVKKLDYNVEMSNKFHFFHKQLEEYQEFHAVQKQNLLKQFHSPSVDGDAKINTLTWLCLDGCNGVGDRMQGMYTTLILAMLSKRVFFVYENEEMQNTMYVEPNLIDWGYYKRCIELEKGGLMLGFGQNATKTDYVQMILDDTQQHLTITHKPHPIDIHDPSRMLEDVSAPQAAVFEKKLVEMGVGSATKDDYFHYLYPVMNHFLYKLPQVVLKKVKLALESLDLTPQGYVAVHIRTGFKNSWFGEMEFTKRFREGWRFARSEEVWKGILECAVDLADKKFGEQSSLFLCADDAEPKQFALDLYGDRIKMLDTHPTHVGRWLYGSGAGEGSDNLLDNWVEMGVLAEAHTLVKVPSGFSVVASQLCALPPANKFVYHLREKKCIQGYDELIEQE